MLEQEVSRKSRKKLFIRRIVLRTILIIYDVLAINVSFIITLYLRFYVAKELHEGSIRFFELFTHYTPFYTLFCIMVFACFKLYNGMWRYSGFRDLNRILEANLVCVLGHVIGTLFLGARMPRSFYLLGGILQLCLMGFARFSFRIFEAERKLLFGEKNNSGTRAMIVGIDDGTRYLIRKLETEKGIHPLCIIDYEILGMGTILDGIPIVSGISRLEETIRKYNINYVIFTSHSMPEDLRKQIRRTCLNLDVELEDYYDELGSNSSMIMYSELIDKINSKLEIIHNNVKVNDEDILMYKNAINNYKLAGLSARDDVIYIELNDKKDRKLDVSEEWVKEQENETGEQISFF